MSAADNGFSPLFRSFNPTLSAARTFPRLTDLLNNSFALGEKLPNTSRTLNFRVVARDNQDGGGGIHSASMQVTVVTNSGPFFITSPNSAVTWSNIQNVTWNVAGTTASPVNAAEVDLLLSTDGGLTFPFILATNVPNDGAHPVLLPNLVTDTARIKVRAANNIFFDISDANFSIIESIPAPTIIVEGTSLVSETCVNGALDPNETVTINFLLRNIGSAATTNLIVSLLSTNGLSVQTAPQTLGVLQPNDPAVSIPITFAAAGSCGGQLQAQFRLQDGSAELGTLIQPLALGNAVVSTTIWSNSIPMSIPAPGDTRGTALPFPSSMLVSGITGTVVKVEVTLQGLTHGASDDIDILLTGPGGQNILLMSDAGNGGPVNNLTLTFNDFAPTGLSGSSALTSGTFKPTNFDNNSDSFPDPAPTGPYGVVLASFKSVNPNGAWSLYVQDDFKQNGGSLQGWNLKITTSNVTCCGSSPPQSDLAVGGAAQPTSVNVGSPLVFSLRVTNLGPATAGSVTVTDALPASVALILASSSQGTYSVDGSLVSFDLGPLTNGAIANVSIAVEPTLSGSITNRAWVSTANVDPDLVNNYVAQIANINSTNHPPVLLPIADRIIHAGSALQITNSATDPEIPTNPLTFSLGADPPAGAEITPTGVFHWQTSDADLNTTNQVTIRVTDDGLPALFDQDSFLVTVIQRPMIASIVLSNASVVLTWNAIAGQRYQVEYQETLTSSNGVTLPPIITASGAQASFEDPLTSQRRYYRVVVLP